MKLCFSRHFKCREYTHVTSVGILGRPTLQFEIIINVFHSFEYLCYGSTAIYILNLTVWGWTLDIQVLTSKVDPRTIRVKQVAIFFSERGEVTSNVLQR